MRIINAGKSILVAFLLCAPAWAQTFEIVQGHKAVPNEVLVKFRSAHGGDAGSYLVRTHDLRRSLALGRTGPAHYRSGSKSTAQLVKELSADPDVEYAEPNYIVETQTAPTPPSDPMFTLLWGLQNTGQSGGIATDDIQAVPAWGITTGGRSTVVGVVDTGIDYTHPDLKSNIWTAPTAFTVQFGTNDKITCAAGTHGYDAITNTCNPMDQNGHGTHVSGTIGASGNNSTGVTGVNWTASMMGLRFMDSNGKGTIANAIRAIQFAIQVKAALPDSANIRVLSNSWGGAGNSQALLDAINLANRAGILFVAAAGNEGVNQDVSPSYPGSYRTPNLISVAATDNGDVLAAFSNFGLTAVDLAAPGVNIASTYPNSGYASMSGTSMSTAYVAGAAALVLSACALDTTALRANLITNVDALGGLVGKTVSSGRLNVYKAVSACEPGVVAAPAATSSTIAPAFTLSAPQAIALTVGGAAASTSTSAFGIGGFKDPIVLSTVGLPGGLSTSVSPLAVIPGGSATLKVTALASSVPGSYTFTLRGVSAKLNYSVIVSVIVSAPASYKLTVSPATASVHSGSIATFQIAPVLIGNFKGTITLQVSGLPPYSTTTFTRVAASTTVTMDIATTKRTPLLNYTVFVVGSAPKSVGTGILKQSAPIALKVTP